LAGPQPYIWCRSYGSGPDELELFQENISKNQNQKIIFNILKFFEIFFFLKFFLVTFQVRQARSHSFGAKAMAEGPPDMKCYKEKNKILNKN
jgi:hypothetical protein